ncbi:MAG: hypothetical protein IPH53_22760 [Flavobacteriales bacterium]|nr:hypothetical protein [Flavobacteriales bacterium]
MQAESVDQNIAHIFQSCHPTEVRVNGTTNKWSIPASSAVLSSRFWVLNNQVVVVREEHHTGVWMEREQHAFPFLALGDAPSAAAGCSDVHVHAIERSGGEHGPLHAIEVGDIGMDLSCAAGRPCN